MLIGLISDTHNQLNRTRQAITQLQSLNIQTVIHCGDLTRPSVVDTILSHIPNAYFVYGNNDDPDEIGSHLKAWGGHNLGFSSIITLANRTIGVTHGDNPRLMQQLAVKSPNYLLFGHSHIATDFVQGSTHFINPGALHRAPKWTFATLDLSSDTLSWLQINED